MRAGFVRGSRRSFRHLYLREDWDCRAKVTGGLGLRGKDYLYYCGAPDYGAALPSGLPDCGTSLLAVTAVVAKQSQCSNTLDLYNVTYRYTSGHHLQSHDN